MLARKRHQCLVLSKYLPVLHLQPDSSSPLHPPSSVSLFLLDFRQPLSSSFIKLGPPRQLHHLTNPAQPRISNPLESTTHSALEQYHSPDDYIDLATEAILPPSTGLVHDHLDPNAPHSPSQSSRHTLNRTGARASESEELGDFNYRSVKSVSRIFLPPTIVAHRRRTLANPTFVPFYRGRNSTFLFRNASLVQQQPRDRPTLNMPGPAVESAAPAPAPAAASPTTAPGGKISHAPERKYKCQYCSRAFSRSEHRSRHERSRRCSNKASTFGENFEGFPRGWLPFFFFFFVLFLTSSSEHHNP